MYEKVGKHDPGSAVFLITGPSASGKTTVAELLAKQFPRGVHLEGDFFRRSIVGGRLEMTPDASDKALEQLRLRYKLGAIAADTYFRKGFTVVLEDVVAGPLLDEYVHAIESKPLHVVCLMPSIATLKSRELSRENKGYTQFSVDELYDLFENETPHTGIWLDTSSETPDETVQHILRLTSKEV